MSKEFKFPDLGEGIAEGELVKWLVKEGDQVKADQEVAEVETDKALVNIPAPSSGVVEKLHFDEGDIIKVGATMITFKDSEGKGAEKASEEKETEKEEKENKKKDKEKKTEKKKEERETKEEKKEEKTQKKESEEKEEEEEDKTVSLETAKKSQLPPLAAPYTRKIARELKVDIAQVRGTGPGGRITEEDVRSAAEAGGAETIEFPKEKAGTAPTEKAKGGEAFEKYGEVERIPLKGIRKKISENMLTAAQQSVMVTHIDEAQVEELTKIRKEKAEYAKERGVKLTLLPFIMKACVIALKDHPYLNASLVEDEIIVKKYYHFGFAIDTEAGLMVPVIRDVDKKSIMHLASDLVELSGKARNRKISLEELQGSTFSITNIGSIGGRSFTPIINYPDSAILGLGRTYDKPIVEDGEIVARTVLPLCLTFDHRITDGATAARFVNQVIQYLRDPDLLLLDDGED